MMTTAVTTVMAKVAVMMPENAVVAVMTEMAKMSEPESKCNSRRGIIINRRRRMHDHRRGLRVNNSWRSRLLHHDRRWRQDRV